MAPASPSPRPAPQHAAVAPWLASIALHGGAIAAMLLFGVSYAADAGWRHQRSGAMTVTFDEVAATVEATAAPPPSPQVLVEPSDEPVEPAPIEPAPIEPVILEPEEPFAPPAPVVTLPDAAPRRTDVAWLTHVTADIHPVPATLELPPVPSRAAAQDAATTVQASPLAGHNVPPRYPFVPWRRGIEGAVVVELEIDATGVVRAARVASSSGNAALDESARSCLRTWRFTPASNAFGAIACTFRQTVVFRIREQQVLVGAAH